MLNASEKAKELIGKYVHVIPYIVNNSEAVNKCAKRCAIICVEQIIDLLDTVSVHSYPELRAYWNETLEIIKNSHKTITNNAKDKRASI